MVSTKNLWVLLLILALVQLPAFHADKETALEPCEFLDSTVKSCTNKFLISAQLKGLPPGLRVVESGEEINTKIKNNALRVSL